MRLINMLGLAALAAITASAFVAVSPAAANETSIAICAIAELECEPENLLVTEVVEGKEIAQIHGTANEPTLLTSVVTVECEKSLANISVDSELGESLLGDLTELKFSECFTEFKEEKFKCEVKTVGELGDISFTKAGSLLAKAISDGGTKVNVSCSFIINCTYGGKPELTAHSDEKGITHLLANKAKLEEGEGFACPEEAFWDADYKASAAMYIES